MRSSSLELISWGFLCSSSLRYSLFEFFQTWVESKKDKFYCIWLDIANLLKNTNLSCNWSANRYSGGVICWGDGIGIHVRLRCVCLWLEGSSPFLSIFLYFNFFRRGVRKYQVYRYSLVRFRFCIRFFVLCFDV